MEHLFNLKSYLVGNLKSELINSKNFLGRFNLKVMQFLIWETRFFLTKICLFDPIHQIFVDQRRLLINFDVIQDLKKKIIIFFYMDVPIFYIFLLQCLHTPLLNLLMDNKLFFFPFKLFDIIFKFGVLKSSQKPKKFTSSPHINQDLLSLNFS